MNRNMRIIVGCLIAACLLLLLSSCATAPGRGVSVETARQALQAQYPELLRTFDLHQGVFSVNEAVWDTLSRERRTAFLEGCLQARRAVTGETVVRVDTDGDMVAVYDSGTSVFYGSPMAPASVQAVAAYADGEASSVGSEPFLVLLSLPRPVYPVAALRAGVEGTVQLQARIGPDGRVREIMPVDGGIPPLNSAALEAASKACFRPLLGGKGSVWVRIPMRFTLPKMGTTFDFGIDGGAGGFVDAATRLAPDPSRSAGTGK